MLYSGRHTCVGVSRSPWRPCSWTEKWPVWGPKAVGVNRTCLPSRGPQVKKEQVVGGESLMRLPTATLREIEDGRLLHTKTCWVGVTDLSEESMLEAGRNV